MEKLNKHINKSIIKNYLSIRLSNLKTCIDYMFCSDTFYLFLSAYGNGPYWSFCYK